MLWKTHLRISFEVLKRLDIELSPQVKEEFRNGIVAPDQWKDYPHHYGKSEKIRHVLLKARGYFLQDDYPNAFFNLGVALHYIQDSHTSFASFYPKHHSWEEDIHTSYFVSNLEKTINYSLSDKGWEKERCLRLAESLSNNAQGRDHTLYLATLSGHEASKSFAKPVVDLNLALRASYIVSQSVLSPKNSPELENKLSADHSQYQKLLVTAEKEQANKIIELANQKDSLMKRKVHSSGIVSRVKNWILGIRISLKNLAVNSNYKRYIQQKHLEKVVNDYTNVTNQTVASYRGWYNFCVPQLNLRIIKKELLTTQEVSTILGENESALKELLTKGNIKRYYVKNVELIERAELDRYLSNYPVNGFVKCPYENVV